VTETTLREGILVMLVAQGAYAIDGAAVTFDLQDAIAKVRAITPLDLDTPLDPDFVNDIIIHAHI
jgi:hypothetical protein